MEKIIHQGRNIKRFREMMGVKQDALALELGEDWNQQKVSLLEQKEEVDDKILTEISKVLKVPMDAFKNFDEVAAVNYFNTFNDRYVLLFLPETFNAKSCNFNPIEKWLEVMDENKKLYERLLQYEKDKVALLERILERK